MTLQERVEAAASLPEAEADAAITEFRAIIGDGACSLPKLA